MQPISALLQQKTKMQDILHKAGTYSRYDAWFRRSLPESLAMCCQVVRVAEGKMTIQVFHAGLMTWCRYSSNLLLANFQKVYPKAGVRTLCWQLRPMMAEVGTHGQTSDQVAAHDKYNRPIF